MPDIATIRTALANRIATGTGLRTLAEAKDAISPPVAVVIPGQPLVRYGETMDGQVTINLRVLIAISDGPPVEKVQRALDGYLGIGSGEPLSIAGAIQADPTLGGTVGYAVATQAGSYGRIEYAGIPYFGARIDVEVGT